MTGPEAPTSQRRYAGKSAEARRAERHERLLDAGLELFGTSGYATASIPRLCTAAGVSSAHFYESFTGKEALLVAVHARIVGELQEGALARMTAAPAQLEAQVRAGLEAFAAPLVADERKARINFVETVGVQGFTEYHRRNVLGGFGAVIRAGTLRLTAAGELPERDLRVMNLALVGAANEPLIDWFVTPELQRRPIAEVLDELVRIYCVLLSA